jgi:osmotically inducible protein OsmC
MVDRQATTVWQGDLRSGKGETTLDSSHANGGQFEVTFPSRAEAPDGRTSPEELLAAAHATCYSMALSNQLTTGGNAPENLQTQATVTLDRGSDGLTITKVTLVVRGTVPGVGADAFQEAAQAAKAGCPVSKALAGNVEIALDAQLV